MTLNFFVKTQLSGTLQIVARFYHDGKLKDRATGLTVLDKDLLQGDSVLIGDKKDKKNDKISSQKLLDWRSRFDEYNELCRKGETFPNLDQAIAFTVSEMKLNGFTVVDAFNRCLTVKKKLDEGTKKKYKTVRDDIAAYDVWRLKPEVIEENEGVSLSHIMLDTLPKTLAMDFSNYLTFEKKNTNVTNKRKITTLKTVLKFAGDTDMTKHNLSQLDVEGLKCPPSNRFPVEEDELTVLKNFEPINPSDRIKLDAFLFVCETGLRHEDLINICPVNIELDEEGEPVLEFVMGKGGYVKIVTVPLSTLAYNIAQKYTTGKETPFFGSLTQANHLNSALKSIFLEAKLKRLCQINVKVGSHTQITNEPLYRIISIHMGRHTYGTLMIERGTPVICVKETMGHSKLETTMQYIRPKKGKTISTVREIMKRMENNLVAV